MLSSFGEKKTFRIKRKNATFLEGNYVLILGFLIIIQNFKPSRKFLRLNTELAYANIFALDNAFFFTRNKYPFLRPGKWSLAIQFLR